MTKQETIPNDLNSALVVGNVVEYQSIEVTRVYINAVYTENALKADYKNVLKVFNNKGEIVWRKIK